MEKVRVFFAVFRSETFENLVLIDIISDLSKVKGLKIAEQEQVVVREIKRSRVMKEPNPMHVNTTSLSD